MFAPADEGRYPEALARVRDFLRGLER